MHQQLWGYKVEEKLYVGVSEQKRLNTTAVGHRRIIVLLIILHRNVRLHIVDGTGMDAFWVPLSLLLNGCPGSFKGVNRPERGVDHLPASSAKAQNGAMSLLPLICPNDVDRDNFTFETWLINKGPVVLLWTFQTYRKWGDGYGESKQ